jgi:hypothetical protein
MFISLIFPCIEMKTFFPKNNNCHHGRPFLMIPRLILYIPHCILLMLLLSKGRGLDGLYKKLSNFDCSDDFTDNAFLGFDHVIKKYMVNRNIVSLVFILLVTAGNWLLDCICHFPWLVKC